MSSPRLVRAAIVGLGGLSLSSEEAALLHARPPAGIILFARNIQNPEQLADLMASLRNVLPEDSVRMVDQEGGRVARLRPPHFAPHPPCGALHSGRAAWLQGALIGAEAAAAGFDTVCAPVLDVRHPGGSDVVGDRAFAADAQRVGALGGQMAAGLLAAGVQPVGKHVPGHGRATADSHLALPHVTGLDEADLAPFAANVGLPWWMTAHVVYDGIDTVPATLSRRVIGEVIRGRLGYRGLLVSDDLAMHALSGTPEARARAAWDAGCDLATYCPGDTAGTAAVLAAAPVVTAAVLARMRAARAAARHARQDLDVAALTAERAGLLAANAA